MSDLVVTVEVPVSANAVPEVLRGFDAARRQVAGLVAGEEGAFVGFMDLELDRVLLGRCAPCFVRITARVLTQNDRFHEVAYTATPHGDHPRSSPQVLIEGRGVTVHAPAVEKGDPGEAAAVAAPIGTRRAGTLRGPVRLAALTR